MVRMGAGLQACFYSVASALSLSHKVGTPSVRSPGAVAPSRLGLTPSGCWGRSRWSRTFASEATDSRSKPAGCGPGRAGAALRPGSLGAGVYERPLNEGLGDSLSVSIPNYRDWKQENRSFAAMVLWMPMSLNLSGNDSEPERVSLMIVTADVFQKLGVKPAAGPSRCGPSSSFGRPGFCVC